MRLARNGIRRIIKYSESSDGIYYDLKVALHVRVNFRESYREYLATMFRRESKYWRAGSLRELLRAPGLPDLSEHEFFVTRAREHLLVRQQEYDGRRVS